MIRDVPSISGLQKYLVVDDHAGFRKTLRDFLPGDPVELFECEDGASALKAYAECQPDWTLMDLHMPGIDGLKATQAICEQFSQAHIIILSQFDSPDLREAARAAGACGYVSKDHLPELAAVILSLSPKIDPHSQPDSSS